MGPAIHTGGGWKFDLARRLKKIFWTELPAGHLEHLIPLEIDEEETTMDVKYPHIEVELIGHDGNAFAILGRVTRAMHQAEIPAEEVEKFLAEATSRNYDNLLRTCMEWVHVK
jgi:hypothetical protein